MFKPIYHLNVFYTQLEGIDNDKIVEVCNSTFENDRELIEKGVHDSNIRVDSESNECVMQLRTAIKEVMHKEIDTRLQEGEIWAHVLRQGDTTMIHTHRNKKDWAHLNISWVYYAANNPNTEFSGRIVFQTQIGGVKNIAVDFQPKVGDLIIFPSWLQHFTTHNMSPDLRVSISGNYKITSLSEAHYNEVAYDKQSNIRKLTGFN